MRRENHAGSAYNEVGKVANLCFVGKRVQDAFHNFAFWFVLCLLTFDFRGASALNTVAPLQVSIQGRPKIVFDEKM